MGKGCISRIVRQQLLHFLTSIVQFGVQLLGVASTGWWMWISPVVSSGGVTRL